MTARQRFNPIDRTLRRLRARTVGRFVPAGSRVLDVGCGLDNWLIASATAWSDDSLGIDPDLDEEHLDARGQRAGIADIAARRPGAFDAATSLAVIEHLPADAVAGHLEGIRTSLRPGGLLFLTTPAPRSKPILEFLAFKLRLISAHEIRDHRHYYDRTELATLLTAAGFEQVDVESFQFGLNQRALARRPAQSLGADGVGSTE